MTLDELKDSAPRSFDKTLVELIAAIQLGERPITDVDSPVSHLPPEYADAIVTLAGTVTELHNKIAELEAIIAEISKVEIWKPKDAA